MNRCVCTHSARVHRRSGRCEVIGCPCLFAPPRTRTTPAEPKPRGTAVVDENGILVSYTPPQRKEPTSAQRILREAQSRKLERLLWRTLELAGLPLPDALEYQWARSEGRRYRADGFYRLPVPTLIEVQGGIWAADPGRHNRGSGYERDLERSNLAALLGYRVLAFSERMIRDGTAVETIRRAVQPEAHTHQQHLGGACCEAMG